ncbi:Reticulon-like protein [Rhynchospora pubera]|uniref:Reticulon-like protein n=1 Tax=Rhynchospora pubera TaxID=906938 RepID=A0AAV8GV88_9POAL|nr:Reticulon-like protein [Rhynchospora pubera]
MESPKPKFLPPPYQVAPPQSPPPSSPIPTSTPPSHKKPAISPSPLHLSHYIAASVPLHNLLSPSPKRRSKSSRSLIHEEPHEPVVNLTPRKKRRGRAAALVVAAASGFPGGCVASPRAGRRARRRLDKDAVVVREEREREREKEIGNGEEEGGVKVRKKRQCKTKKVSLVGGSREDLSLVPFVPPAKDTQNVAQDTEATNEGDNSNLGLCDCLYELIMWKDVAKSTLWFGLGSIFFLSTSFSRDFNFSLISSFCHLGVFILGMAFLRDSFPQRSELKPTQRFQFTEEDVLSVSRVLLPIANEVISKVQLLFSGDPATTIKVLPILLFGAKYGHLITFWRLFAAGFFFSFTIPKLYSSYSEKINRGVKNVRDRAVEAWRNCPRKKFVAASAATMFWNLFSVKTRIIAAFVSVVILRYNHQQNKGEVRQDEEIQIKEDENHEMVTE